jgi:prepilin-type N-terminal cleavage/methylation domain-containing protein
MKPKRPAGVTLVEMMIVVAIIGLMAGISFPAVSNGLDSIRLHSASDAVAAFLNSAMTRAERRREVIEVVADPANNRMVLYSSATGFTRVLEMPSSIALAGDRERHVFLMPGGLFPQFSVELVNAKGLRKRIAIEPFTGTPRITAVERPAS